jgi:hypothetical protein
MGVAMRTKKVLILVMSSPSIDIFDAMMKKQKQTWDSVHVENINTLFFYGNETIESSHINGKDLVVKTNDTTLNNLYKIKMVYNFVYNMEWDYIFRTNASSYIDKQRLLNKAQTLPENRCYCGVPVRLSNGTEFSSGAGTFYSRDCIDILRNAISDNYKMNSELDDVLEGTILSKANIRVTSGASRSDYTHNNFDNFIKNINFTNLIPYHYRCRSLCQTGTICDERKKEPIAFDKLFNYLKER